MKTNIINSLLDWITNNSEFYDVLSGQLDKDQLEYMKDNNIISEEEFIEIMKVKGE